MLAIVIVVDEDDCSVADPELMNADPSGPYGDSSIGHRCVTHPEGLHPVSRYVEGLLALRTHPRRLVVTSVAGVPRDLVDMSHPGELSSFLGDDRMQIRFDEVTGALLPSCELDLDMDGPEILAFPPRRIVELQRDLWRRGAYASVQSACTGDFESAFVELAEYIGMARGPDCLVARSRIRPGADGRVPCVLEETLAEGSCRALCDRGRRPSGCPFEEEGGPADPCDCGPETVVLDPATGREVCKVDQISFSELAWADEFCAGAPDDGWFFDDCSGLNYLMCRNAERTFRLGSDAFVRGASTRLLCSLPSTTCRD